MRWSTNNLAVCNQSFLLTKDLKFRSCFQIHIQPHLRWPSIVLTKISYSYNSFKIIHQKSCWYARRTFNYRARNLLSKSYISVLSNFNLVVQLRMVSQKHFSRILSNHSPKKSISRSYKHVHWFPYRKQDFASFEGKHKTYFFTFWVFPVLLFQFYIRIDVLDFYHNTYQLT